MENGHLSPKALSKEKHKINAWITEDMAKRLNQKLHENKQDKSELNTKSKIIYEALETLGGCPSDFSKPHQELYTRITFYLNQEEVQFLWNLESHYLGEGIKRITVSTVVNAALMVYLI